MSDLIWKDWSIEECIGQGASGTVYRISRQELGNTMTAALKVIRIPKSPEEGDRLLAEGMSPEELRKTFLKQVFSITDRLSILGSMRPGSPIVPCEDFAVFQGSSDLEWEVFIQMPLLQSLSSYCREHRITEEIVIRMGRDLCSALQICRQQHVLHRDIKPDNIFCTEQGAFLLGDFDIACREEDEAAAVRAGSLPYMAPEARAGEVCDHRTDLYSLGVVMKEILPAKGSDRKLRRIIKKACAKLPDQRYASAAEMARDLNALQTGSGQKGLQRLVRILTTASACILAMAGAGQTEVFRPSDERTAFHQNGSQSESDPEEKAWSEVAAEIKEADQTRSAEETKATDARKEAGNTRTTGNRKAAENIKKAGNRKAAARTKAAGNAQKAGDTKNADVIKTAGKDKTAAKTKTAVSHTNDESKSSGSGRQSATGYTSGNRQASAAERTENTSTVSEEKKAAGGSRSANTGDGSQTDKSGSSSQSDPSVDESSLDQWTAVN